jgi:hypothetical protein
MSNGTKYIERTNLFPKKKEQLLERPYCSGLKEERKKNINPNVVDVHVQLEYAT